MNKVYLKSVAVLGSICLVVAVLLAAVNFVTAPIIEKAAKDAQQKALREVLPDATSFIAVEATDEVPETVNELYRDEGGAGYAFIVKAVGNGGATRPMTVIVGIDMDGRIAGVAVTDVSGETADGTRVAEKDYLDTFVGKDSLLDGVSTISGATISSKGFIAGIKDAFTAFYAVAEIEQTEEQKIAELIYTALPGASSDAGFESVPLTDAMPDTVLALNRAKNRVGCSVVVSDGTVTLVVGVNSFGIVTGAYDMEKTDRRSDSAVAALIADAKEVADAALAGYAASHAEALGRLLAEGSALTRISDATDFPTAVIDAYTVTGDSAAAYAFVLQSYGYKSVIRIAVTVSESGAIVKVKTLFHYESKDYGAKVGESKYTDRYTGITEGNVENNADLLISGSTVSSSAYRSAVAAMFDALDLIKGGSN
jgi:electron transport complex protein RnfG